MRVFHDDDDDGSTIEHGQGTTTTPSTGNAMCAWEDDDDDSLTPKKRYVKESKGSYIFIHVLGPAVYGLSFLVFYFFVKEWVRLHEN